MSDSRLQELITQLPALANATRITELGGLTNTNYRVENSSGTYVLRISNEDITSILGINRQNERVNTGRAHRAGVGAAIVDSLPQENVLVMQWIEARTLHAADLQSEPSLLPRIVNSLKMLHAGPAFQGDFHFPSVRRKYLKTVLEKGYFVPNDYFLVEPLVNEMEKILASAPEASVPCNNDLLAENFLDDGNKIWIIDFEYSGQNEASFEIGNLASESFLSDEQLTLLCNAYWGAHLPSKIIRAMAWSIIARYGWIMWASIQEAISPLDFDFRSWGMAKWNSVLPELKGTRYHHIVENLKKHNV